MHTVHSRGAWTSPASLLSPVSFAACPYMLMGVVNCLLPVRDLRGVTSYTRVSPLCLDSPVDEPQVISTTQGPSQKRRGGVVCRLAVAAWGRGEGSRCRRPGQVGAAAPGWGLWLRQRLRLQPPGIYSPMRALCNSSVDPSVFTTCSVPSSAVPRRPRLWCSAAERGEMPLTHSTTSRSRTALV